MGSRSQRRRGFEPDPSAAVERARAEASLVVSSRRLPQKGLASLAAAARAHEHRFALGRRAASTARTRPRARRSPRRGRSPPPRPPRTRRRPARRCATRGSARPRRGRAGVARAASPPAGPPELGETKTVSDHFCSVQVRLSSSPNPVAKPRALGGIPDSAPRAAVVDFGVAETDLRRACQMTRVRARSCSVGTRATPAVRRRERNGRRLAEAAISDAEPDLAERVLRHGPEGIVALGLAAGRRRSLRRRLRRGQQRLREVCGEDHFSRAAPSRSASPPSHASPGGRNRSARGRYCGRQASELHAHRVYGSPQGLCRGRRLVDGKSVTRRDLMRAMTRFGTGFAVAEVDGGGTACNPLTAPSQASRQCSNGRPRCC